jgi:hypothetical protein
MSCKRAFLASVLLAACVTTTASARAASVRVYVEVSEVVFGDFATPASWTPQGNGALIDIGQGQVHARVDFFVSISGLRDPENMGLAGATFDVVLGANVSDAIGWIADTGTVDHDGIFLTPEVPKWTDNGDLGTPGDLIDITVGVETAGFGPEGVDIRRTLGKRAPEFMGSVFASIDSNVPGTHGDLQAAGPICSVWSGEITDLEPCPGTGGTALISVNVPEPPATALLILGLFAVLPVRSTPK